MENNGKTTAEFTISPALPAYQRDCAQGSVVTDTSADYTLPEYMPEIRKILRISSRLLPSGRFMGTKTADFSGSIVHTVLYCGESGETASANIGSDYEFSVPLGDAGAREGAEAVCQSSVESVICRLGGSRKMTIRSRIRSVPHIRYTESLEPKITGKDSAEDGFSVQTLEKHAESARVLCGCSGEFPLSDTVQYDGAASPVFCEGRVLINEALPAAGGINCRGELSVKCLLSEQPEEGKNAPAPVCIARRIPFEQFISVPGADEGCRCRAIGRCITLDIEQADGSIAIEAAAEVCGEAVSNIPVTVTSDIYSTDFDTSEEYANAELRRMLICRNARITATAQKTLGDTEAAGASEVIDADASVSFDKFEAGHDKSTLSGELTITAALSVPGSAGTSEPAVIEFSQPLKIETDGTAFCGESDFEAEGSVCSVSCRMDGDRITVTCEVGVSLAAYEKNRIKAVRSASLDKERPVAHTDGSLIICYPDGSESLWDIAKKYRRPVGALAKQNKLDGILPEEYASPASLDGMTSLIIM